MEKEIKRVIGGHLAPDISATYFDVRLEISGTLYTLLTLFLCFFTIVWSPIIFSTYLSILTEALFLSSFF